MDIHLQNAIENSHPVLTSVFAQHWNTTLNEFASLLYQKANVKAIDVLLLEAFHEEFLAFGVESQIADKYLNELRASAIVQTAHHVTPTNGPAFLTADVIAMAGLPTGRSYLVGTISGLPFSNPALSGCLLFTKAQLQEVLNSSTREYRDALRVANHDSGETTDTRRQSIIPSNKVSLISARMRNALVYSSKVPDRLLALWPSLTDSCRCALTVPIAGEPYSYWACRSCAAIQREILQCDEICYFDMNRVISRYIQKSLATRDHPLKTILFGGETAAKVMKSFNEPTLFLGSEQLGRTPRVVPLKGTERGIRGEGTTKSVSAESLMSSLVDGTLCPSMFLVILSLTFLNGIRCFGGYLQVEYVEMYRKIWQLLELDFELNIEPDPEVTLTTGRLIDNGVPVFSLDLHLSGSVVGWKEFLNYPMSYFWEPVAYHLSTS